MTERESRSPEAVDEVTRTRVTSGAGGSRLVVEGAVLVVESGPDAGREIPLPEHPVVIGRGETADVRLGDASVSREHLRLEPGSRGWRVLDLGSKSGVRLSGIAVRDAELPPEAPLSLGATVLRLRPKSWTLELAEEPRLPGLVGASPGMRRLAGLVERLARLDLPVLILGETGTGKELLARSLHTQGPRHDLPYRVIDCTLLADETQAQSELFGHVRGAFTGAERDRAGAFRDAHRGTVFLDEIGELPAAVQAQLLRVLQEGEVRPLGSDQTHRVRVRVVAATHRDLRARVAEGRFRQDLFHRLAGMVLEIPPLRDRLEDLDALIGSFLPPGFQVESGAREALRGHRWPGNVRELRLTLERAAALCRDRRIRVEDLALDLAAVPSASVRPGSGSWASPGAGSGSMSSSEAGIDASTPPEVLGRVLETPRARLARITDQEILEAIARAEGNRERAADLLGISPASLYRRLRTIRSRT